MLSRLGSLVLASVCSTDVVARYSGDQFGLLFVETSSKEAQIIVTRLLELISARNLELFRDTDSDEPMAAPVPVTASLDMTGLLPDDTMESPVKRADVALSQAKASGRGQVKIAD